MVRAHGRTTRITTIVGGAALAAGLVLTLAGGLLWAGDAGTQQACQSRGDFLCFSTARGIATFSAGVAVDLSGALVLGIGELARSEERYRFTDN